MSGHSMLLPIGKRTLLNPHVGPSFGGKWLCWSRRLPSYVSPFTAALIYIEPSVLGGPERYQGVASRRCNLSRISV
jgi:hypothetical protein